MCGITLNQPPPPTPQNKTLSPLSPKMKEGKCFGLLQSKHVEWQQTNHQAMKPFPYNKYVFLDSVVSATQEVVCTIQICQPWLHSAGIA